LKDTSVHFQVKEMLHEHPVYGTPLHSVANILTYLLCLLKMQYELLHGFNICMSGALGQQQAAI